VAAFWAVMAAGWIGQAAAAKVLTGGPGDQRTVWDGVFTEEQARRGKSRYESACGYCHMDDLSGGGGDEPGASPPALVGPTFLASWRNASLAELAGTIAATMPFERPKLEVQEYIDIVSYLLQANGMPAGPADLPTDAKQLKEISIVAR
jgi:quinoprotein glucose dehydrogenase